MAEYQLVVTYLRAWMTQFRHDERGSTMAQEVVIIGASLLGAAVVAAILWNKLKTGANNVTVNPPNAP